MNSNILHLGALSWENALWGTIFHHMLKILGIVTRVDVIGDDTDDYAINVYFEERHESLWFVSSLLEFVDHGAGTEITLEGIDKKWTRTASGNWLESPGGEQYQSFWERITGRVFRRKE